MQDNQDFPHYTAGLPKLNNKQDLSAVMWKYHSQNLNDDSPKLNHAKCFVCKRWLGSATFENVAHKLRKPLNKCKTSQLLILKKKKKWLCDCQRNNTDWKHTRRKQNKDFLIKLACELQRQKQKKKKKEIFTKT